MTIDKSINGFLRDLASGNPIPGSGGATALGGSMAAALIMMVCRVTIDQKRYADAAPEMTNIFDKADGIKKRFSKLIDEDALIFEGMIKAFALPDDDEPAKKTRTSAIEEATRKAALMYLEMMHLCCELFPLAMAAAVKGNVNAVSEAGAAALLAGASAQIAALNVNINLMGIQNRPWAKERFDEMNRMLVEVRTETDQVLSIVTRVMKGGK